MFWTCMDCRDKITANDATIFRTCFKEIMEGLQKDIRELKDNQLKVCDKLTNVTCILEEEKSRRIKVEEELAGIKSQLTGIGQQVTKIESHMDEQCTEAIPTAGPAQATPTAPPLPNLLLGTSLLRNVDPSKLNNWEVLAKGGTSIDDLHKELSGIPESKNYNEVIMVCGSSDLESKGTQEIVRDCQAMMVSASLRAEKVVLSSILPRKDKDLKDKTRSVNEELKSLCDKEGFRFVENDPSFYLMNGKVNDACLVNDGLHLSKRGVDNLLHNCGVLETGSAFTMSRYPDSNQNTLLFKGHKSSLSNFYPVLIRIKGKDFKSTEAAYQYQKAETMDDYQAARQIMQAQTALQAMRIAGKIQTDDRWKQKKHRVMESLIKEKIKVCKSAKDTLLNSGTRKIVEDTSHEYWGREKSGKGENALGKIWMAIRAKLQEDPNYLNGPARATTSQTRHQRPQKIHQRPKERTWATRSTQPQCYQCGEHGHGIQQCRKADVVSCWACGQAGHKQKHCGHYKRQYEGQYERNYERQYEGNYERNFPTYEWTTRGAWPRPGGRSHQRTRVK